MPQPFNQEKLMARILCLQDAMDYLRLCDGDSEHQKAVRMVRKEYLEMRERYTALRASFAVEVKHAYDGQMQKRDDEITRLKEQVLHLQWQKREAINALHAPLEDYYND
jgi:hypothetical protein